MGKTSQKEQKVELPPEIKAAALANLDLAKQVGQLPYAPNFGMQVAGFSPTQQASFDNTNAAAQAFGLPSSGGTGLPPPTQAGGFSGYSTQGVYNDAMSKVPPGVLAMYNAFFADPQARGAGAGGGKGGKGGVDVKHLPPPTSVARPTTGSNAGYADSFGWHAY